MRFRMNVAKLLKLCRKMERAMCSHVLYKVNKINDLTDSKIKFVPHFVPQLYPNLRFVLWVQHSLFVMILPRLEWFKSFHSLRMHITRNYHIRENKRRALMGRELVSTTLIRRTDHSRVSKIVLRQDAGNA